MWIYLSNTFLENLDQRNRHLEANNYKYEELTVFGVLCIRIHSSSPTFIFSTLQ